MRNPNRLSAVDAAFLDLERSGPSHMHVASVLIFAGAAPTTGELIEHVQSRLHLVPRYRQRLATVPFGQGRPVWVDDPYFNAGYHIRRAALPSPGGAAELQLLAGRLFSQPLDRSKPLWEMWLVERLTARRFALIVKTHHAVVDGISGVDIATVLFDGSPEPAPAPEPAEPWIPQPLPGPIKLMADAWLERRIVPARVSDGTRELLRSPRTFAQQAIKTAGGIGSTAIAQVLNAAPPSPLNVEIGSHRRYTWVDADLSRFREIKNTLGGTVNDVVLTAVALALGEHLRREGQDTDDLVLRAMVPVSTRRPQERGAWGNRVTALWAPLPVGERDPKRCMELITAATADAKSSSQAEGARALTELAGLAPPTIAAQAARLQARQRLFNLVVTNVPGPQAPLYVLGRELERLYPVVPLAHRQALGIAVMSYNGRLGFGLLSDYDAFPGLDRLATDLAAAIEAIARTAGVEGAQRFAPRRRPAARGATRPRA